MNSMEKALLIIKAKNSHDDDIKNMTDLICQLKRPEILLTSDELKLFHEYATEWYDKGWIIYTSKTKDEEDEGEE